ncbi:molybdopterin molybdenumtransferase MoeA [Rhodobacteraceae bacterium 2CG4]|uniref:Molybdopterin molybdenumtransferase n=1 Tax=Halovulum marinum TaxID=2662447 RepID=A0A6L5Z067_9RHOB|nr:gephyrin-like molybdotransferase Glp [Halovulum marinum]MSU89917.1 molybdopterin molybdenumtransferase MoeA [Halovulum marinum]
MIPVAEARARILAPLSPLPTETVPLARALGRVLAEPVAARRTQPPFDASAMDGYAVRRAEAGPGAVLRVIGESAAGARFDGVLGAGQAVRIFTGAPLPAGADDVLIQEDADRNGDRITVRAGRDEKRHIRPAGDDFAAGDVFPGRGPLGPADIALLAAMNHAALPLRRRPVVALIATGDELVMPGAEPGPDQIVSSNNFGLAAMLTRAGAVPRLLPIAADRPESLAALLELASDADLIVTLGGASVGDHDLVRATALAQGLELGFYKVAMRPGKPLMAGTLRGTTLIGLPGNPVSAMVCGAIFVLPAVRTMLGLPPGPETRAARLAGPVGRNGPREHYMRARLEETADGPRVTVFERQDSALLHVLQAADCLAVRPADAPAAAAGDLVQVVPLP